MRFVAFTVVGEYGAESTLIIEASRIISIQTKETLDNTTHWWIKYDDVQNNHGVRSTVIKGTRDEILKVLAE